MTSSLKLAQLADVMWRIYPDQFAERASGGRWRTAPHLRYMAHLAFDAISQHWSLLAVNAPSRHRKSWFFSWWLPVWFLEHFPEKRIIMACYGANLAESWGQMVRDEFDGNPMLRTRLRQDSQRKDRWLTHEGGGMMSVGVGGSVLGFGGDLIIFDDPHKNEEEANSLAIREATWQWFVGTLWSRREPQATVIVAHQRFHWDDLTGRIVANLGDIARVVRLPALAEPGDPLGRQPGEPLDPERYSREALELNRRVMPNFDAMFQQEPPKLAHGRAYARFLPLPIPAGNLDPNMVLRDDLPLALAFDFNVNPGVHCLLGQDDPHADVSWVRAELFAPRLKTPEAMDLFAAWVKTQGGWHWPEAIIYGDRSGKTETTLTTQTDYDAIFGKLDALGIPYRICVPKQNPPIKDRLDVMNDALCDQTGARHLFIHPDCVRLLKDLEELPTDADGLIDKSNTDLSHPSDALGYRVHWVRPLWRPKYDIQRVG